MPNAERPDLSLFLDILRTLERMGAPYMIIGGFAATMYGITRTTFDIDIVVDLQGKHIRALAEAYPSPRYYADPGQMRTSSSIFLLLKRYPPLNVQVYEYPQVHGSEVSLASPPHNPPPMLDSMSSENGQVKLVRFAIHSSIPMSGDGKRSCQPHIAVFECVGKRARHLRTISGVRDGIRRGR
jgi:hypothetical protein